MSFINICVLTFFSNPMSEILKVYTVEPSLHRVSELNKRTFLHFPKLNIPENYPVNEESPDTRGGNEQAKGKDQTCKTID